MKRAASAFRAGLTLVAFIFPFASGAYAQPVITSFGPVSGVIGSSITITGANFSAIPSSNIVYFGGVKAAVTAAATNSLTVKVPRGATHSPISVTTSRLTAYSRLRFVPTFVSDGVLEATSFGPRIDIPVSWPGWYEGVAVADIDGDGKLEMIATINHSEHSIWILRHNGVPGALSESSFDTPLTFDYGASGISHGTLAIKDLDGDGKLDFVVWNDAQARFAIFRNTSTPGTISLSLLPYIDLPGIYTQWATVGDVDLDGKPDLLVAVSGGFTILPNKSAGGSISFDTKVDFPHFLYQLAVADIDADGRPDLVGPFTGGSHVSVARNIRLGTGIDANMLAPVVQFLTGQYPFVALPGDLDGDGKLDLIVNNRFDNTISLLRNLSTPGNITSNSFAPQVLLPTSADPFGLALGDLNGDGKVDLVSGKISVFKNQSVSGLIDSNSFSPPFDFDASNTHGLSVADLNGDGQPEIIASLYDEQTIAIYPNKVSSPPLIAIQPSNVIATLGADVTLTAAVTGWPLEYQWTFNATNLPGATNASLTLSNVQFHQVGVYAFVVSNQLGTAASSNALVTVTKGDPIQTAVRGAGSVSVSPATNHYFVGQTISLTATPGRYYTFLRWSDAVTSNPRTITLTTNNVAYTAIFTNTVPLEELTFKLWDKSFGGSNGDEIFSLQQTSDGGFILGGYSNSGTNGNKTSPNYGDRDFWVVRLDASGSKLWDRSYGGTGEDVLVSVRQTDDGGFILGGYSRSGITGTKTTPNAGNADMWVVRVDAAGNQLWDFSLGGGGNDAGGCVRQTTDGGFVVAGMFGADNFWIVHLDRQGNYLWEKTYGGPGNDEAQCIEETFDGGFIVAGYASTPLSSPQYGGPDFWALRLDRIGDRLWDQTFGGSGQEIPKTVRQTPDGGFILAGYSRSLASGNKSSTNYGNDDLWVVRVGPDGNWLWDQSFGGSDPDPIYGSDPIDQMPDGGFILGGISSSTNGTKTSPQIGSTDFWLVRLDANGRQRWDLTFGGTDQDGLNGVQRTSDGGLILGGYSQSPPDGNKTSPHFGDVDFWVVRLGLREGPVGAPAALVNGQYSPSNTFVFGNSNIVVATLQTTFTNGAIFYTLDGASPTTNSARYTAPFRLIASAMIRAIAYNSNRTQSAEMDALTVTINNSSPTVTFNSSSTYYLNPGANAFLSAGATDPDGPVTRVEFYQGTNLLSTITNAPYDLVWTNPPPGRHSVSVRAYDAVGAFNQADAIVNVVTGTVVSGFVNGQTWIAQNGPYYVAGNVQATNLTIAPGAFVLVGGNYQFEVLGQFTAIGSNGAPIQFTTDTNVSGWGGVYFNAATGILRMEYCIVERSANSGLRIHNCSPTLRWCTIRQNSASEGGGLWADAPLTLESSSILDNQGGGVYSATGGVVLRDCRVRNNVILGDQRDALRGGAGIYSSGPCSLYDCNVVGNRTLQPIIGGTRGGGLWIGGRLECYRTTISSNEACAAYNADGRGGGVEASSDAVFSQCVLQGNKQGAPNQSWGGAVYCPGTLWMTNCLITGNQATSCGPYGTWVQGSAVFASDGVIENCTISHNALGATAFPSQAAIGFQGTIRNSIAYFNTPAPQIGPGAGGGNATVFYSDVQGGFDGANIIDADPLFANGTNHMLAANSPCVDAGDPATQFADACFPPSLGTQRNDMGAYGGPFACGWSEFGAGRPSILVNDQTSLSNTFVFGSSNIVIADIQSPFNNGSIFYSLDGNAPTTNSIRYTGPIQLVRSSTLRAIALNSNRTEVAISYSTIVTINNNSPAVNLATPANGATYLPGQNISLTATVSDSDGSVQRVEFYASSNLLTTVTNSPFSLVWSNVPSGNYLLRAVAYDNVGASSTSSVSVLVLAPLYALTQGRGSVIITPPGQMFAVGASLSLQAEAARFYRFVQWSDGDTNIARPYGITASNYIVATFTNTSPLEELVFPAWERTFGGASDDNLYMVRRTADGGFILAGSSRSRIDASSRADCWIIKTDPNGIQQWDHAFGGSGDDYPSDIILTDDGGYLFVAATSSAADGNKGAPFLGVEDSWVVKIDAEGHKQSEREFGGSDGDAPWTVARTIDGGYLIAGVSSSQPLPPYKTAPARGDRDAWLLKLNANADLVWDRSYGSSFLDSANVAIPTRDGGTFLAGSFAQTPQDRRLWTIKTDGLGVPQWLHDFGTGTSDQFPNFAFGARQTADNGFVVLGVTPATSAPNKSGAIYGGFDLWLLYLNQVGTKIWDKTFGGGIDDYPGSPSGCIQITPDSGFILAGYSSSPKGGNKDSTNYGGYDGWIIKTDREGAKQWELNLGGSNYDAFNAVEILPDGYLFAGRTQSSDGTRGTTNYGGLDYWLVKMFAREAPVGTPVVLVNGQYSPSNNFTFAVTNQVSVTLSTTITNGRIHYTLNGPQPSPASPRFTNGSPIVITQTVTLRSVAFNPTLTVSRFADPVTITMLPLYSLTNEVTIGGTATFDPPVGPYLSNSVVVITATPSNGWTFVRWAGDASGADPTTTITMDRPKSVRAIFGTVLDTIVLPEESLSQILRTPPAGPYAYGSTVRLFPLPAPGEYFLGWFGDAEGTSTPLSFPITNSNPVVSAFFDVLPENNFTLTVLVNGGGTVSRNPDAGYYARNASLSVNAIPGAGSFFAGWSGDASGGNNPLTVTMTTNKTITANFATTPVNLPPTVSIVTPSDGVTFTEPADIAISVNATDSDGTVDRVEFFEGTNLLGTVFAPPFSFPWSSVPAGSYTLNAQAIDNGGVRGISGLVHVTVATPATNPPVFSFSNPAYDVDESAGSVTVTVLKSANSAAGTVNFITFDVNARSGFAGGSGDYAFTSGSLTFTNGDTQKSIVIAIHEDLLVEGFETFTVALSSPSEGGVLGSPNAATVRIHDNETAATNSVIERIFPAEPPSPNGLLRVTIKPPEAFGQWRFVWEPRWRDGGVLVPGLVAGNYEIEFKPVPDYIQPPNTIVPITLNALTSITNEYFKPSVPHVGALRVDLLPDSIGSGAQWRRQGETNWHVSGETIHDLSAGSHIVEFRAVMGWLTPAARGVTVVADQENMISGTYQVAENPPGTPPSRLGFSTIIESPHFGLPYAYVGQLSTPLGFGSGFIVRERVVLTAAHVVFDDVNLSYVDEVSWFFQRHRGEFDPRPQMPRGWYVLSGYAAQREADHSPGVSSTVSQDQDVAALFFLEPAGRGGSGGYLMSSASPSEWLSGSRQRLLVGYPVEMLSDPADAGKMHAAGPFTSGFNQVSNQVYATTQVKSFPGNSGGPICVLYTNNVYYPAAIYLGGSNQTIVRAIDERVVDLINRAVISGNDGGNNTGGGAIIISPGPTPCGELTTDYVQVEVGPPAAIAAGAAWRVTSTYAAVRQALASFTNFTSLTRQIPMQALTCVPTNQRVFEIQFKSATGFDPPTGRTVETVRGQNASIMGTYVLQSPARLTFLGRTNLAISGTPGRTYRIEFVDQLRSSNFWRPFATNTLTNGWNPVRAATPSTGTNRFYRAVWLP